MHGVKFLSNILNFCEHYTIILFFFLVEMLWFDPSALSLKSKYKYSI